MLYKLSSPPTLEVHSENLIHLFVRDANGSPLPNTRVKVWAGPPPTGSPPYWVDESPYRLINAAGMLEFIVMSGAMPESRDYWMQVIDATNQTQSDPVQFHFPSGGMVWITATLTKEGTSSGGGGTEPTTPISVNLDPRLAPMNVTVKSVTVNPGQAYWKIVSAKYQDENESGGNHNVYYTVLDQTGAAAPGVPIFMDWVGRDPNDIPSSRYSDGNGTGDQAMYGGPTGWRPELGPGPYTAWVGDPDYRGNNPTGIPSEKLVGCGLPLNRHVNFVVTWRKVIAPTSGGTGGGTGGGTAAEELFRFPR